LSPFRLHHVYLHLAFALDKCNDWSTCIKSTTNDEPCALKNRQRNAL
jgi:hypothetical protein